MKDIKLIVGLNNPGLKYNKTRHNLGAQYVYLLAKYTHQSFKSEPKLFGDTAYVALGGSNIHLLVPNTFMNLSGKAIEATLNVYHIQPEEILVAHDEMDLLPGVAKFKQGGGHGGHNGLKDIINKLSNSNFHRLRFGIGHPSERDKVNSFILSVPALDEQKLIDSVMYEAVCCTELWLKDKNKAMNRLHSFGTR
ncbi:aminoacyl-tRNA hydrolase [Candidatus Pantoea carbekii]|nr:aminoacyl-tRNA hydrolase [Candidatus Pantoea carbekii]AKC32031.1 peptidyl-tRNA hydrolase Pth [Candidatus Pantoea carbekii]